VLQYTGGTTGVSKGAVLLHRNLVANVLQAEAWYQPALKKIPPGEQIVTVCALPLYHIFGFNTNMMLGMRMGGCNILIPTRATSPAVLKELSQHKVPQLPGGQHAVQCAGQPPRLRQGRLEPPEDQRRRRHGGAAGHRAAVAREDRLPDLRRLRPVGDQPVGHLQPGRQPPPTAATSACRCPAPS
jgi:acyl-CoA synthetase (AMP-forming)/AMP-acid ligase II